MGADNPLALVEVSQRGQPARLGFWCRLCGGRTVYTRERAVWHLMARHGLTEPQAHRALAEAEGEWLVRREGARRKAALEVY